VSAVPNALVLFNPALVLAPFPGLDLQGFEKNISAERFGCEPEAISPTHHVGEHTPPTLILHGRADTTVPFTSAEAFATEMKKKGKRCELVGYEDQTHGFFNSAKFEETLAEADKFLVSLGYLPPAKTAQ
jgi:acetyl esterase/lipase